MGRCAENIPFRQGRLRIGEALAPPLIRAVRQDCNDAPVFMHVQGVCMVPVQLLASKNVQKLIVGGIGMRPLMGFNQVEIVVY